MRARNRVLLGVRLVGLASALFGIYQLIQTVQAARAAPALESMRQSMTEMMKDTPVAGMFGAVQYQPDYLSPALWLVAGLVLMAIAGPLTRFLFSGIEPERASASGPS